MSEENRCPECGAPRPAHAPKGLCPGCLLKRGLETAPPASEEPGQASGSFTPPTPEQLAAQFPDLEILEFIGRGGMGMVYKARQKHLDRLVALKILLPSIAQDAAFAERFGREARAMAMLSHPHIVTVHDFGQTRGEGREERGEGSLRSPLPPGEGKGEGGLYYFVMEFVDGLTLRQLLDAGKLAPQEALAIVPQICEALQFAHDKGVVHRDIKPENILMDRSGQVKIADFGLAKLMGKESVGCVQRTDENVLAADDGAFHAPYEPLSPQLTGAGQVMGTPHYMAPEQFEHPQEVDHRADIYSLGVVFYQMLTGELPIGRFAPPSRKVQIDVRLDEVVLRALEKEPDRRYQQASQIRTEVETIVHTGNHGRNVPSPAGTNHWNAVRRLREILFGTTALSICSGASLLGILIILGVIGNFGLYWHINNGAMFLSGTILLTAGLIGLTFCIRTVPRSGGPSENASRSAASGAIGSVSGATGSASVSSADDTQQPDTSFPSTGGASGTPAFPRLSRLAIAGAVWAPFFLGVVLLVLDAHVAIGPPSQQAGLAVGLKLLAFALLAVGLMAPFGTTILGLVSLSQIRHSAGRLYELGLALFDALLYPLLILDGLIGWLWYAFFSFVVEMVMKGQGPGDPRPVSSTQLIIALTLLTSAVVDYFIVRAAWRAASSGTGSASAPSAADTERRDSPRQSTGEAGGTPAFPRLSRLAIAGAVWAPFFLGVVLLLLRGHAIVPGSGSVQGGTFWFTMILVPLMALGLAAPFGTTILGLVSLSQIRHSAGRLYGLGLALFDALLYPLLILNGLIGWLWYAFFSFVVEMVMKGHAPGDPRPVSSTQLVIALTLLTSAVVDYFIVRAAWRAASSGTGSASAPSAADTERRDSPRQSTAEAGGTPAFPCLSRHALIGVIWTGLFCILILIATLG